MEKEFVSYEIALALKELGFDKPCFCIWNREKKIRFNNLHNSNDSNKNAKLTNNNGKYPAPTFSQAFRWFREKHIIGEIKFKGGWTTKTSWYDYVIYSDIDWVNDKPNKQWKNYEEAELECLKKIIEIVKNK